MTDTELHNLLACLNEPALVMDEDGRVISTNSFAARFLSELEPPFVARPLNGSSEYWLVGSVDDTPLQVEGRACSLEVDGSKRRLLALKRFPSDEGLLQRLKVLEERYELAISTAQLGVFDRIILTENAPPPYWTASMRQLLGYDPDLPADPDWFLERVEKSDKERMAEANRRSSQPQGDGKVEIEVRWNHPDGEPRNLWVRSQALRTTDGNGVEQIRSVGVVIDVTEHRALEAELRQSQRLEAVGRLAGGVAHDFNNLLSVVLGYNELVVQELGPSHPSQPDLEEIGKAAERAALLTRQLLAFGRKQVLQPKVLNLSDVLNDFSATFRRVLPESITLQVMSDDDVKIFADQVQLQQVLLNLVINSRDAMPEGGHLIIEGMSTTLNTVEKTHPEGLEPGEYAVVAVSDTGLGMDRDTQERIFEPFFTTKGENQGTGLGLATVFGIVRQSGGGIWVYSEPGHGTTFKIYLPATGAPPWQERPKRTSVPTPKMSGTVLIAEDDDQLRTLVGKVLLRAGFQVLAAPNPIMALEMAKAHGGQIDLLITDVVMPHMTGRELANALLTTRSQIRVLYMSGYTENGIVHHGLLEEGVNFLAKPITPVRLIASIEEALSTEPECSTKS